MKLLRYFFAFLLIISLYLFQGSIAVHSAEIRSIHFPVEGLVSFNDNFGDPRNGHTHEGIDMLGEKMMRLLSAVDGKVSFLVNPEASWGYAVFIKDNNGYEYRYLHMNDDTPGTDDGNGGPANAYAPGISKGTRVTRGQFIGWMGDSGNAESAGAHLHFEIRKPGGSPINPYESLIQASESSYFEPEEARISTPTINIDKQLKSNSSTRKCDSGALIKSSSSSAVYYCGEDNKRYVFPHENVYLSWYTDFEEVITITEKELASIPLGGNVTYRPGVKMVKVQTYPKVYAVAPHGILRWVLSSQIAEALYGKDWSSQIDDISDAFFVNYSLGEPITFTR